MSWFNLNYIFGESSETNTGTFIPRSSVHTVCIKGGLLPQILTMGEKMMITRRRSCPTFVPIIMNRCCETSTRLLCLTMITVIGVRIVKPVTVPHTDKKNMAIIFLLVVPRAYNKTLVSLLTRKSHWVTSNPLALKFRTKLIRYE
ncbi:hypothetical protein Hanom_Chr17g01535621 [Helianthus anomalus]